MVEDNSVNSNSSKISGTTQVVKTNKSDSSWTANVYRSTQDTTPIKVKVNSLTALFEKAAGDKE